MDFIRFVKLFDREQFYNLIGPFCGFHSARLLSVMLSGCVRKTRVVVGAQGEALLLLICVSTTT